MTPGEGALNSVTGADVVQVPTGDASTRPFSGADAEKATAGADAMFSNTGAGVAWVTTSDEATYSLTVAGAPQASAGAGPVYLPVCRLLAAAGVGAM